MKEDDPPRGLDRRARVLCLVAFFASAPLRETLMSKYSQIPLQKPAHPCAGIQGTAEPGRVCLRLIKAAEAR
ncbi:hypothetical protein [Pseudoxanthomonas spadix]|uniref:hypothetical protein n=1 Tax=Pseudoxanthomonas spadix TaxID=415229 RepID=UPI0014758CC5|nr:hypothetical protein [Pseudoxanthomonas spadix]MBP3973977.1 hypothetical protein [Pseudoxanthomonas spadix]